MGDDPVAELLQITCLKQIRDITERSTSYFMSDLSSRLLIYSSVWTNIKPALLKYIEDHKSTRLERARRALLVVRFRLMERTIAPSLLTLSKMAMVPHIIDICLMDEARLILDVPTATTLTAADFTDLITLLPLLAQRWRTNIESQYIQHVSSNERTMTSNSVFDLVTSCKRCDFFPDTLTHECHNLPRGRRKQAGSTRIDREENLETNARYPAWA